MTCDSGVLLFTDGACQGNPGPGGWAFLLRYRDYEKEMWGSEPETTNNRMELMAVIQGLEAIKRSVVVTLYTDSLYVKNGFTQWLPRWKAANWKTCQKKPVKNIDLWQRLEGAAHGHRTHFFWIKGHAGHPDNERVDKLARAAIVRPL